MESNRRGAPGGGARKFTVEVLVPVVAQSRTITEVCRRLGVPTKGNTPTLIARYCQEYGLDTDHMVGRRVSSGGSNKLAWNELLVYNRLGRRQNVPALRRAMIESGIPYVCFGCANTGVWMDRPLTLDIDHLNGDELDNRPQNLRFACPNCHRQTDTWGKISLQNAPVLESVDKLA